MLRSLINSTLLILFIFGLPMYVAAQETELQILRRPLGFTSNIAYWGVSKVIQGGPLQTVVRMSALGLPTDVDNAHELSTYQETLLLQSAKGVRCFIPLDVINKMGFGNIEEFRVYLNENDIYTVECIVEINAKINVAKAVSLYFNFTRASQKPVKPSQVERALP